MSAFSLSKVEWIVLEDWSKLTHTGEGHRVCYDDVRRFYKSIITEISASGASMPYRVVEDSMRNYNEAFRSYLIKIFSDGKEYKDDSFEIAEMKKLLRVPVLHNANSVAKLFALLSDDEKKKFFRIVNGKNKKIKGS